MHKYIYIYTNRCGKHKVILGPVGCAQSARPTGKKENEGMTAEMLGHLYSMDWTLSDWDDVDQPATYKQMFPSIFYALT